jgi:predicted nuclease of predicted toxin-antitoxin system
MHLTSNPDLRLILDEMISPYIVPRLWESGIDAVALRDRAKLRITDHRLLTLGIAENRAVATINEVHFENLAARRQTHPGIAVITSGGSRDEQYGYVMGIAAYLRDMPDAMAAVANRIICINESMQVDARIVCAPMQPISAVRVGVALAEAALGLAHGFAGPAEVVYVALALTLLLALARFALLVLAEAAVSELFEQLVQSGGPYSGCGPSPFAVGSSLRAKVACASVAP